MSYSLDGAPSEPLEFVLTARAEPGEVLAFLEAVLQCGQLCMFGELDVRVTSGRPP
ncbi:MAG: hypothetical protein AB1758_37290 [Candidatus Eremiobacterota bacterium]